MICIIVSALRFIFIGIGGPILAYSGPHLPHQGSPAPPVPKQILPEVQPASPSGANHSPEYFLTVSCSSTNYPIQINTSIDIGKWCQFIKSERSRYQQICSESDGCTVPYAEISGHQESDGVQKDIL